MGANVLSHSKIKLFNECGRKYDLHYNKKIRPTTRSSALCFGTAFDKAIEAVLNNSGLDEKNVFDTWWKYQKFNNEQVDLSDSILMVYYLSDFDIDLLNKDDVVFIESKAVELLNESYILYDRDWVLTFNNCLKDKKNKTWTLQQNIFYNICVWLSMRRKGHIMLDAHRAKILPRIKRVLGTQKEITLNNGDEGDTLVGSADALIEWEDGRTVVIDYKTSSVKYEDDSVITSPQLIIYSHSLQTPDAGFFVFRKKIIKNIEILCTVCGYNASGTRYKKCPNEPRQIDGRCNGELKHTLIGFDCDVNVIIDTITDEYVDSILDGVATTNENIKKEEFEPNFKSCQTVYGPCVYFDLCHKNSMDGLKKYEK